MRSFKPLPLHEAVLCCASAPAVPVSPKPIRFDNGVPVYAFEKEIIRCGDFLDADDQPFSVDRDLLSHWLKTFRLMMANKVAVPVPSSHAEAESGDKNRGFVTDMRIKGGGLFARMELVGEEAKTLAASNDVSIFAEQAFTDCNGNTYQWPIRHVALTPDPRITGLKDFVSIAAANKKPRRVPVLRLDGVPVQMNMPQPGDGAPLPTDSTAGDPNAKPKGTTKGLKDSIKEHFIGKAHEAMANEELPHEGKLVEIDDLLTQLEEIIEAFEDEEEAEPQNEEEEEEEETPEKGAAMCNVRASNRSAPKPDPMLLKLANKSRQQDIDKLFSDGYITKPQREQLAARWCGAKVALTLSNAAVEDFDETIAMLGKGYRVRTGEQTGAQVLALSNPYIDPEAEKKAKQEREDAENFCRPSSQRAKK